jgi:hypothetical protein
MEQRDIGVSVGTPAGTPRQLDAPDPAAGSLDAPRLRPPPARCQPDAQTRTATASIHRPAANLITADEVKAPYGSDRRARSIGDARGVLGPVAGEVTGEAGAIAGHDPAAGERTPD